MKIRNLPKASRSMIGLLALASMPVLAASDTEQSAKEDKKATAKDATVLPEVAVSGQTEKTAQTIVEKYKLPVTVETVTKQELDEKVNVFNTEDAIKYEPSILVRKRYVGDTNAPVGTRTATTSQSARTLIYADGILLSTLLNNNNGNTGSPRWNTVAPNEIDKVEMMYGPFSAAYAGNSMGGVINITTKMPDKFMAYADAQASWQDYSQYGHSGTYETQNYSGGVGDRVNDLSFRFDYNHLDSYSQPIAYGTQVTAAGASGLLPATAANNQDLAHATPVTGAYMSSNTYGRPMAVLGETALNHTIQDNFKWKLAYDITSTLKASYTLGMWQNNNEAGVNSFLRDANGNVVNSGLVKLASNPNIGTSLASAMLPSIAQQTTWSHGMNLHSETGGKFDWELVGSVVDLSEDFSKAPTNATTSTGKLTSLNGTNWHTVDAKGIWRPGDFYGNHEVSFGFHHDMYELANPVTKTGFWQADSSLPLAANDGSTNAVGKTTTEGYWLQDSWDFAKDWNFTTGGRLENWNAYDGVNSAWANNQYQVVNQNNKHDLNFSPKGKLTWTPTDQWKFGAAIAKAYRYPTVGEMFQTYTTSSSPTTLVTGNPNLKPENALSSEISAEYFVNKGKYRLSFFQEQVQNAIFSTISSVPNISGYQQTSIVNNIGQTDAFGLEFSGNQSDVGIEGLDLFGSATWTDARITNNLASDKSLASAAVTAANLANNPGYYNPSTSALMPRIPQWRATFGATYKVNDQLSTTVNGRYSDSAFGQLNNSDINHKTYVGVGGYFVVDTKVNYKINKQFTLSGGIDNINNENYWIYHPFPQRTYVAQLKFNY
ncbi:MAG: TonB-dependent receptor [Methylomonas sp.]